jgi:sugar lactone lactonase YvrE
MRRPIETLATGLGHPEGPDVLPDGRIVMVETYTSRIIAWSRARGIHLYADCGGGPNACMLGSDGALYITQNGGTVGAWRAAVMVAPSIQRAWPDGRVETVITSVDGIALQGGVLRARRVSLAARHASERADRPAARGPCAGRSQEIAASGDLWVTTFMGGGVDILGRDGTHVDFLETGGTVLNCVFHDGDLVITDMGDIEGLSDAAPMGGRLWRVEVGVAGMPLFRGAVTPGTA